MNVIQCHYIHIGIVRGLVNDCQCVYCYRGQSFVMYLSVVEVSVLVFPE